MASKTATIRVTQQTRDLLAEQASERGLSLAALLAEIADEHRRQSIRVEIGASAGIDRPSRAICRAVRAVVRARLVRRLGHVEPLAMDEIETVLALILGLDRSATAR